MTEHDELTDDAIAGNWRVLQRRRGHRYSIDDVVTAWQAAGARPDAARYLDLGCGIGSVLLMVAYKLRDARVTGVEAQDISIALARQNVARNGLEARVRLVHGDFRERAVREEIGDGFDLITGTPPYLPADAATLSPDPQRAAARIELRGGVEAYVATAAPRLARAGRFVVCAFAKKPERVLDAAAANALVALERRDVIPRDGADPLFTVWTLARADEGGALTHAPPFIARTADGTRTDDSHRARRFFDMPDSRS